jgi:hypothetical protein
VAQRPPTAGERRNQADLNRMVLRHEKILHDLHADELGKPEKDAFPKVLEAWVAQAALARVSRRRLALLIGIAAAAGPIAQLILRYFPTVHP